jgi:hypothetical protein
MDAPRVKTSRGRLLRNNSIPENFGHDDKNDFTRLSFPSVVIGNPFCRRSNSPLQKNRNSPFFKGGGREADGGFLPSQRDVVEDTDKELNGGTMPDYKLRA